MKEKIIQVTGVTDEEFLNEFAKLKSDKLCLFSDGKELYIKEQA